MNKYVFSYEFIGTDSFGKFVTQVRSIITERSIILLVSYSSHTHDKPVLEGFGCLELVD